MEFDDPRRVAALSAAALRLRVDYAAAEAIRALAERDIACILLKGASITRWLYEPEDGRAYADCDLLVRPGEFEVAVDTLRTLGYEPELDEAHMPSWWREHALSAVRQKDGVAIDLHRNLPGTSVTDERLWSTLSAKTDTLVLGDVPTQVLTAPARALHAALHAAQHSGLPRDLDVLTRAIDVMDDSGWRAAAELAAALGAIAAFRRGLCFLPAGAALADRLGLEASSSIDVELRAINAPEALTVAQLMGTRGLAARMSLVRHKLAPPATFMRKWSPVAAHGRFGLALAYAWRPLWVVTRVPRAVQAWSRARQRV